MSFRLVPTSVTLNDLELRNNVNVNMRFIVTPLLKEHGCIT